MLRYKFVGDLLGQIRQSTSFFKEPKHWDWKFFDAEKWFLTMYGLFFHR